MESKLSRVIHHEWFIHLRMLLHVLHIENLRHNLTRLIRLPSTYIASSRKQRQFFPLHPCQYLHCLFFGSRQNRGKNCPGCGLKEHNLYSFVNQPTTLNLLFFHVQNRQKKIQSTSSFVTGSRRIVEKWTDVPSNF